MKYDLQRVDALNANIAITIEPDDYQKAYQHKLKELRASSQMKGFRKGKTPMSMVKKLHGPSVLVDIVNNKLQAGLMSFIEEQKLEIIGTPLLADDQMRQDFSTDSNATYDFKFDIGLLPDVDVKGLDTATEYKSFEIELDPSFLDEQLERMRDQHGNREDVSSDIKDNDVITVKAVEVDDAKSDDELWETEFGIIVSQIPDEDLKAKIIGSDLNFSFEFDIFNIENNATPEFVRKYLLKLPEDQKDRDVSNTFSGEVTKITRLVRAELNEDFFSKAFPEREIKTKEEALEAVKNIHSVQLEQNQKAFTDRMMLKQLVDLNDFELPMAYIKKLVLSQNEKLSEEDFDNEESSYQNEFRWSIIRNKLIQKYDIKIDQKDVRERIKGKFESYLMQNGMANQAAIDLDGLVENSMNDQQYVEREYLELVSISLFDKIKDDVTMKPEVVSVEEFNKLLEKDKAES